MCVLADVAYWVLWIYVWIVIAAALLSWFGPDPRNPAVRLVYRLTDPLFTRVRRRLPPRTGIDFSPMIVCFAVLVVQQVLVHVLRLIGNC